MRANLMLPAVAIALSSGFSGCSLLINHSGVMLRNLDSREIVYERFGPPDSVSLVSAIDPKSSEVREFEVEHYHVHAKFNTAMPIGAWGPSMLLLEPFLTSLAVYEAASEVVRGHDLAFVYDDHGNTIGHHYPRPFLDAVQRPRDEVNVLLWERRDSDQPTSLAR